MSFDKAYAKNLADNAPPPDKLGEMDDEPEADAEEAEETPEDEAGEDAAEDSAWNDFASAVGIEGKGSEKAKAALKDFIGYCTGK